jgi:hypothetical protein
MLISPMVAGKALLIPRVEYRPKEGGWRALVVIDVPGTRGDAIISDSSLNGMRCVRRLRRWLKRRRGTGGREVAICWRYQRPPPAVKVRVHLGLELSNKQPGKPGFF